jgi:hypothetical protein
VPPPAREIAVWVKHVPLPEEQRRDLLFEVCFTYTPLEEGDVEEYFRHIDAADPTAGLRMKVNVLIRQAEERGARGLLVFLLEERFGRLSTALRERIDGLTQDRIRELAKLVASGVPFADLGLAE